MKTPRELVLYQAWLIERDRGAGETLRQIATRWGVSHVAVLNLINALEGGGWSMAMRAAAQETAGDFNELQRRAGEWHSKNPLWLPRGYRASGARAADFIWWDSEIAVVGQAKGDGVPPPAWVLAAAGAEPAGSEPRPDRRGAYVRRMVEHVLDLPDNAQAELERRHKAGDLGVVKRTAPRNRSVHRDRKPEKLPRAAKSRQ